MECPKCGSEMEDRYKKTVYKHLWGRAKNTLRCKTKKRRVYYCSRCNKYFILTYTLAETEVIA